MKGFSTLKKKCAKKKCTELEILAHSDKPGWSFN
jgi:hypothetical protein